jgi:hypothetical protein
MTRASDYFKYYEISTATALAADIVAGIVGYIAGGRVVGQGSNPSGSLTAFYLTQDSTLTPQTLAAWKTAYNKTGLITGFYYPGLIPPSGGLFGIDLRERTHTPINDTFILTER